MADRRHRSVRMQSVAELAQDRERQEARRFGGLREDLRQQALRLEELCAYRAQYSRQLAAAGAVDASRLRDYRSFLTRLNQAIAQQERHLAQLRAETERQRAQWQAARHRVKAMDQVMTRLRQQERRARDRAEQREQDEMALRSRGDPFA